MWPSVLRGCFFCYFFSVSVSLFFHNLFPYTSICNSLTSFYSFTGTEVDLFDFARRPVKRCCTLMLMWTVRSLQHNVTASSRASLKCLELMGHLNRIHAPIPLQEMTLIFLSLTPSCIVLSGSQLVSTVCEQSHLCLYIERIGGVMDFLSILIYIYFEILLFLKYRQIELNTRRTWPLVKLSSPASF